MLTGTPVVAYRSGALVEAIGQGGLLVEEGDVRGLAEAIRSLTSDERKRKRLAAMGRQEALSRYSWDVLAEELTGFWMASAERARVRSIMKQPEPLRG
jgi:glycosyltransferase involved in cell wall biosynthesis